MTDTVGMVKTVRHETCPGNFFGLETVRDMKI